MLQSEMAHTEQAGVHTAIAFARSREVNSFGNLNTTRIIWYLVHIYTLQKLLIKNENK